MKRVSRLMLFLSMFAVAVSASASDLYWVSFLHHGVDDCFLMQIDALGNITRQPKVILEHDAHSTAIAHLGATKLLYYANDNDIFRMVVDKATMTKTLQQTLPVESDNSGHLQITQGGPTFFLAFEANDVLKGFPLSSSGKLSGSSFQISPHTGTLSEEGGVSADGRMAFSIADAPSADQLYVQPLKRNGNFEGTAKLVGKAGSIDSADVSGVLANNIRFVVFTEEDNDKIVLQRIDGKTGNKIGLPVVIGNADPDHSDQLIAIDPLGRFVLYSDDATPCDVSSMYYQALDATGHPSGQRKEIIGCAFQNAIGNTHGIRSFDVLMD